jgi:predicted permease
VLFQKLIQDLRYAVRQLRHAPGFAFTVVLTLALSVGVATAVFCVFDTVLLRPLPYANPEKIVTVQSYAKQGYTQPSSWTSYQDERAQASTFAALAAYNSFINATVETPSEGPVSLSCVRSTDNFFEVFGVKPLLGRTYLAGEEKDGKNDLVVLSYEVWQRYFGGNRGVLNQAVKLDGRSSTVIGVMPDGFRFPLNMRNAVYTPRILEGPGGSNRRDSHWLPTVGRIKDGISIQQAQAELSHIFQDLGREYPSDEGKKVLLGTLQEDAAGKKLRGALWLLLGAVFAVLAIGCVNVAGLLLARGVKREREMAMRAAIGAGRARLLGQMFTEGLMLAIAGAAGGVLMAWLLLNGMQSFLIHALARGTDIHLNWTVLAAAVASAVAVSLLASLYPALRLSGIDPNRALKSGGSAGTQRKDHRLRAGFVVTQVALTLVLLVVAGMLIRMVSSYSHTDLGFDPVHILAVDIGISSTKYKGQDPLGDFYRPLEDRVSHLPGVQAAGLINLLPIAHCWSNADVHIAGLPPNPPNELILAERRFVSAGYFDAMGISLHRGRQLTPALDRSDTSAATVMVNDAFVRKFIPANLDPTAQRMDDDDKQENWTHIVGVVGNVRQSLWDEPLAEQDWLMDEVPVAARAKVFYKMSLVVRTSGDPRQVIPTVRSIVHELDPTVPFEEPRTMTEVVSEVLVFQRMESWLFGIFAALALLLALVGLYGLISHEVEQSSRDIGIRMALGATRTSILAMVLKRVSWMLGAGTIVGLGLTLAVRKLIGVVIYLDPQKDAGEFLLVALLLALSGLIAALLPARRAASIDPMQALRSE